MQSIRSTIQRVPRQLNRITKPSITTTRRFSNAPATMSLFPRFTQEFAPIFRLFDEYDRQAFRNLDREFTHVRSFTPKFCNLFLSLFCTKLKFGGWRNVASLHFKSVFWSHNFVTILHSNSHSPSISGSARARPRPQLYFVVEVIGRSEGFCGCEIQLFYYLKNTMTFKNWDNSVSDSITSRRDSTQNSIKRDGLSFDVDFNCDFNFDLDWNYDFDSNTLTSMLTWTALLTSTATLT
jgi:hypothetical protein